MIKNLVTKISIATTLLFAISCQAQNNDQSKISVVNGKNKMNALNGHENNVVKNKVVVIYNNKEVTASDVAAYINQDIKSFYSYSLQQQQALIKAYVIDKLLEDQVKKSDIENDLTFQEALKVLKRSLAIQVLFKKNVPALKEDEYPFYQKQFASEKIKISHILLSSQEKAKEVKDKLSKGESFEKLAKEESLDKETKENGGLVEQWFFQGDLPEPIFAMQEGGVSEPMQLSKTAWQLIKLNSKVPHIPSKEEINEYTFNLRAEKYAAALYDAANVKIMTDALKLLEESQENKPIASTDNKQVVDSDVKNGSDLGKVASTTEHTDIKKKSDIKKLQAKSNLKKK
ncbi:peptidylprolyl isomerase [Orientia tsutsugamushi]|uniref:Parvulin-like PPIase n=1 Tax=Orientia tsutsugamushi (strain Boryong) TaxID=357244 RepID=A5CD14_ORITB|nr:peptidylprolyl isomerase [Orientia tsutsugamushi]CAM79651.1 putative peptidylprolyl isomerase [Orientia tsutsugamushi str. Boryong]